MLTFSKTYMMEFPVARVYSGWVSDKSIVPPAAELEIHPAPGGIYRLVTDNGGVMEGVFLEVRRNEFLRYTWQWDGSDEATEIEVHFRASSIGTELEITHSGFESEASQRAHAEGWDTYVEGLREVLRQGT